MKSIIQTEKECWLCHAASDLHLHHIFFGALRKVSDKHGLTVWLCSRHHNMSEFSVHHNRELDLQVKRAAQKVFEDKYGHEEFMKVIGRNYL